MHHQSHHESNLDFVFLIAPGWCDRDEHYRCHRPLTSHPHLPARAKEAEVTVSIFISQLSTIRAAFDQVRRWTDESLRYDTSHYQLIVDLETSLDSRKHLTSLIIDSQLSNGKNLTSWTLRVKSEWWVARCTLYGDHFYVSMYVKTSPPFLLDFLFASYSQKMMLLAS